MKDCFNKFLQTTVKLMWQGDTHKAVEVRWSNMPVQFGSFNYYSVGVTKVRFVLTQQKPPRKEKKMRYPKAPGT